MKIKAKILISLKCFSLWKVGGSYFEQRSCSKHRKNTLRKQCNLFQWFAAYNIGRKSPLMAQTPIKTEEVVVSRFFLVHYG